MNDTAEALLKFKRVGNCDGRTEPLDALAVGLQQCRINPIKGRPTHQPDNPNGLA
jgi:hypothetical protein